MTIKIRYPEFDHFAAVNIPQVLRHTSWDPELGYEFIDAFSENREKK